jgi:uncharacterized protein YlzI (FlbEa/FlbD family)
MGGNMFLVVYSAKNGQPVLINTSSLVSVEEQAEGVSIVTLTNGNTHLVLDTVEDLYQAICDAYDGDLTEPAENT